MSLIGSYSREEAFEGVLALRAQYGEMAEQLHNANEAKTRLLIIDTILESVGWNKDDFNPETPAGKGYLDYCLEIDNIPRVIVEAKRIGRTFRSPTYQMHETVYSLIYFKRAYGQAFNIVLEQAVRYAHETGLECAVLTNGAEWLLLQVIPPPGNTVEQLRGFYFGDLLSDRSSFDLFWELLSKRAVSEGALEEHLAQLNSQPAHESSTPKAQFGELRWRKNKATDFLGEFYRRFFTDITDRARRQMLEKCFATDARLDQYQGELKRALRDSAPRFLPVQTEDISPSEGEKALLDETAEQTGRVILVTGSVGTGKTTLVTKVLVEARRDRDKDRTVLVIDLIDEVSSNSENITGQIWRYISHEWQRAKPDSYYIDKLRKYFGRELEALRHGSYSEVFRYDENEYLRHEAEKLEQLKEDHWRFFTECWRYYQQKRHGIVLILDNVDRASESYQKEIYAFAHKLARLTGATVIVTMRESTFFKGQTSGFLDVRSNDTVLHLQAPNLEQLLAKRIQYVLQHMDEDHRVTKWRRSGRFDDFRDSAIQYAETLKKVFLLSSSGRDILGILASVSWHNVRYFLDTLRRLHLQLGSGNGVWRIGEVIAALMTAFEYPESLPIISNVFRPPFPNYTCYYLKLRILLLLIYGLESGQGRGGVTFSRIARFGRLYGYQTRWIQRAVQEMVRERYLECLETPSEEEYSRNYDLNERHSFRASPLAVALVQQIVTDPAYRSLIGNDLPFHKSAAFELYKRAFIGLLEVLDDGQIERDGVDLLLQTNIGDVVGAYLYQVYSLEQPASSSIKNLPEISATEQKLEAIVRSLQVSDEGAAPQPKHFSDGYVQLPLGFSEVTAPLAASLSKSPLPIPGNIAGVKIGRSQYAPLIFWALVALRLSGHHRCSGTEITDIINQYLVDDLSLKYRNNVSRALRNETLQSQEWLVTDHTVHSSYVRYGVVEDWAPYWKALFGDPVPVLD